MIIRKKGDGLLLLDHRLQPRPVQFKPETALWYHRWIKKDAKWLLHDDVEGREQISSLTVHLFS